MKTEQEGRAGVLGVSGAMGMAGREKGLGDFVRLPFRWSFDSLFSLLLEW